ncbi:Alcohol dehydrogenase 2 [Syntrophobacter sp. SbD1]|nr:Alcohol dehydrogenase 2 [Syntrophobacter sp. SbD1]
MLKLAALGLTYIVYDRVTPNPRSEEVMAGAAVYHAEGCDVIIAVGGGSPIDCAKGIGIVSSNGRHILEFEGIDQIAVPMPPLICIPTTGGTSADVSQFAIITNVEQRNKIAIVSKAVIPDLSLIDPVTLLSMPPYLTACTALDAMTHGIEAFVSSANSPITDLHALEGIRLIASNLLETLQNPNDVELRTKIMQGSLHTGIAFSNASLGAAHAMAHSLGGYLDIAHGECNAVLLDHVVDFNFAAASARYRQIGEAMGLKLGKMPLKDQKADIMSRIQELRKAAQVNTGLEELGVSGADVPVLAGKAIKDICMVTNPRHPNQRDVEAVYEEAL